jgi:hypothetical protein
VKNSRNLLFEGLGKNMQKSHLKIFIKNPRHIVLTSQLKGFKVFFGKAVATS